MSDAVETLVNAHGDLLAAGHAEAAAAMPLLLARADMQALFGVARAVKGAFPTVRPAGAFRARLRRDLGLRPPRRRWALMARMRARPTGPLGLRVSEGLLAVPTGLRRHAAAAAVSGSAIVAVLGAAAVIWRRRSGRVHVTVPS